MLNLFLKVELVCLIYACYDSWKRIDNNCGNLSQHLPHLAIYYAKPLVLSINGHEFGLYYAINSIKYCVSSDGSHRSRIECIEIAINQMVYNLATN